jgi:serine/threonine protein kinase
MRIEAGTVIAEKYRLEAPLARGGMGSVWIARHVTLGSRLAVKFLDPTLAKSAAFVARFEAEARAAASIESPHVVHVQDFGLEEGTPYLVMELLRGEDLRTRLRRRGRLTLAECAELLVQVGKALRRAHAAGIVHRDIKPGNLFLARLDDDEVLKVLDFGIAKQARTAVGESTKTGELIGTPHYVSPEQARGDKDVDHRTDVWAVGVIAYKMVTGELPFPGDGFGKVLSSVLTETPRPVRAIVPSLPEPLDGFFARALAKKREERFQSVRELVDAFVVIVRTDAPEDSISPPSWSSIVSVSRPPPEPALRPPGPRPAAGESAVDLATADVQLVSADRTVPEPPGEAAAKHDSLAPATGPGKAHVRPSVRFRWVAVATLGLLLVAFALVVWLRGEHQSSPAGAITVSSPVLPPSDPGGPAGPTPSSKIASPTHPQAVMTASSASPPASASAPTPPSTTPASIPAPAKSTPGSRRKWGF